MRCPKSLPSLSFQTFTDSSKKRKEKSLAAGRGTVENANFIFSRELRFLIHLHASLHTDIFLFLPISPTHPLPFPSFYPCARSTLALLCALFAERRKPAVGVPSAEPFLMDLGKVADLVVAL